MKLRSILLAASGMLMFSNAHSQLHVTTGTTKYVLLEECTGVWCGYCPDGAQDIEEKIEPTFPHCIVASWHGPSGYGDPMMVPNDPFTGSATGYFSGFPMGAVDRTPFSGSVGLSRPWDSYVSTQSGVTPKFEVDMKCTYDTTARLLTVIVTGKALMALTGTWHLNALVLEDSISSGTSSAYNQDNYAGPPMNYYTTSCTGSTSWFVTSGDPIMPTSHYAHMNVVRAILATTASSSNDYGLWGDTDSLITNPASGATKSKTYTYTVPAGYNAHNMKVVGMVQAYGSSNNTRPIENCITSKLRLMPKNALEVGQVTSALTDMVVYPNPAQNMLRIKGMLENPADTRVTIYNALGQMAVEKVYPASGSYFNETIDLSNVANGTYFISIVNANGSTSRQFVIAK